MGYTGLEGLLNYAYYQAGALNQYDDIGHLLHFNIYNLNTGPCGHFSSGYDPDTGEPGLPAEGGGTTTDFLELDNCVGWLGPNQPGITEASNLPKYDPSVCPTGTSPERAEQELCSPSDPARANARSGDRSARAGRGSGSNDSIETIPGGDAGADTGSAPSAPSGTDTGTGSGNGNGTVPDEVLEEILDLPDESIEDLPLGLGGKRGGGAAGSDPKATQDLLDFLFSN